MAIIRRTSNWLPSIFNDFFGNEWMEQSSRSVPAVNIQQNENGFTVEVAAPGMTKEDCLVRLDDNNNLVISFEKKTENEETDKKRAYLRPEFTYSQFKRTMLLPDNVEKDKISAKVEHGVVSVEIPTMKEEKAAEAKMIEIH